MRLPLPADLKTRTGAPDKDAKLKNAYVEQRANAPAAVRKRPASRTGLKVGTGIAQGMIGFTVGSNSYVYAMFGDVGHLGSGSGGAGAEFTLNTPSGVTYTVDAGQHFGGFGVLVTPAGRLGTLFEVPAFYTYIDPVIYPSNPFAGKYWLSSTSSLPFTTNDYLLTSGGNLYPILGMDSGLPVVGGIYTPTIIWGLVTPIYTLGSYVNTSSAYSEDSTTLLANDIINDARTTGLSPIPECGFSVSISTTTAPGYRVISTNIMARATTFAISNNFTYTQYSAPPGLGVINIQTGATDNFVVTSTDTSYVPLGGILAKRDPTTFYAFSVTSTKP